MTNGTYRTIQGDTWDSIAFRITGDEMDMNRFIEANKEYAHVIIFDGGITINVPDMGLSGYAVSALPPWKLEDI